MNPNAMQVMEEAGVDISGQSSKLADSIEGIPLDLVITVCGHADEQCPVVPSGVEKIHWPLTDPAKARGNEEEIMAQFRATRDEVKQRVQDLLTSLNQRSAS